MNPLELLLAENDIEGAIALLRKTEGVDQTHLILAGSSQLSQLNQYLTKGLLTVGDSDYKKGIGQIKYNLTEIGKKVKTWPVSNVSPSQPQPTSMNKLSIVKQIFKSISDDLENMAYSKTTIIGYINQLNTVFESKIFSSFSDSLTRGDWDDMTSAEQRQACKKTLEALSSNEEKVIERMRVQQEKLNGTVSLDEVIQRFFDRPSIKAWNDLCPQLEARFADSTLFGERVIHAFNGWKTKLDAIDDELSFAMDFNFDYRSDFGDFLKANLQPKNFNYA